SRYFPKILRNYISKQKWESLFPSLNKKLSVKTNPTIFFKSPINLETFISLENIEGIKVYFTNLFIFTIGLGIGKGGVPFFNHPLFTVDDPHGGGGGAYDMVMAFSPHSGRGGSGSVLYNRFIPHFKMSIKVKR
ncbi:MAG: hypothetical protein OXH36_05130, partial [Bdellovibrionales bacterium]|nr:hypothetical protein [Bdellovibrionales bacterium]